MSEQRDKRRNLDLAMIGNCSVSALIDKNASVAWFCVPRFDGDPMFCSLLDHGSSETGFFDIHVLNAKETKQEYRRNSAILETTITDNEGNSVRIVDFCPRYTLYGRNYAPVCICRRIIPSGLPRVVVRFRPRAEYGAHAMNLFRGNAHITASWPGSTPMRLTMDLGVSFVLEEIAFTLEEEKSFILALDEPLEKPASIVFAEHIDKTGIYWASFARKINIPFEWQDEVIRSSITLKLCSYEESGAILAAMTTSIPEHAVKENEVGRTWDYRFCWLRDSYFTIRALNSLGVTKTMTNYIKFIVNILAEEGSGDVQPLYGLMYEKDCTEKLLTSLPGYRGMGPVRVGNQAYQQQQNDVYGAVVLSLCQLFFDRRLDDRNHDALYASLEHLGNLAFEKYSQPDAGLWELRTIAHVHTFSAVMCWAACDRLGKIANHLKRTERAEHWNQRAGVIREYVLNKAYNESLGAFVSTVDDDGTDLDASVLLMAELGIIDPMDERFVSTVEVIGKKLMRKGKKYKFLLRYANCDDFGFPETAFTVVSFWYVDALALIGKKKEARELFEQLLKRSNHVGLMSEDIDCDSGEMWGNFPQTYSHVGIVNSALKLSTNWNL